MNARSQVFELTVEGRQIEEVVASIFHTLMFHRTLGKFQYKEQGSYSIGTIGITDVDCDFIDLTYVSLKTGTIGITDVDCDFIDLTYVRVSSNDLDRLLHKEITGFRDLLRTTDNTGSGQISLEFYQKKRARWPFVAECTPWEVWTIKLDLISLANEHERQLMREKVGELVSEKILYIAEAMNRYDYIPKMPNQNDLDLIFDTTVPDVQPYLHKITYQTTGPSSASVGSTMRKFLKDTLSFS